ncbi:transcription elongation regulator [Terramyces sp. JEL0728]|nr:transcription elongation regulator [Terramyces sp. JEL0728]
MEKVNLAWSVQFTPEGKQYFFNSLTNESTWERPAEYMPPKPPPMKEKPIKMRKIPNTEWSILLTNKNHEYFYNKASHQVSWDIPEDIVNLIGELLNASMDEEMSEDEEEPDYQEQSNSYSEPQISHMDYTMQEETAALQEERTPAEIVPEIPAEPEKSDEELREDFNQMLSDLNASPFSTWNMESEKLSRDPRFIALKSNKERKSLYEQYCATRAKEIQLEKQTKVHDSRSGFQELLDNNVNSARTRYEDFSRKFKRDTKFIKFTNPLERQQLFQDHIQKLRAAENQRSGEIFIDHLRKLNFISKSTTWTETRIKIENEPWFLAVKAPVERESLFRRYLSLL